MVSLSPGEIAWKPGCRFYKKPQAGCRHMKVQNRIFRDPISATTRLTDRIPATIKLAELRRSTSDVVKGLFILPMIEKNGGEGGSQFSPCWGGLPLVLFGRPNIQGQKADYQHIDLARRLGLTWRKRLSEFESKQFYDGAKWGPEELQPGAWGFVLSPLGFKTEHSANGTRILDLNVAGNRGYEQEIYVDADHERGLVNPRNGVIDLDRVKGIEMPTAKELYERRICAFLMRAAKNRDHEVWGIYARSVLGGDIPDLAIPVFLQALAHHVAPEFMIFQFLTDGKSFFYPNAIKPFWKEAVSPNCLKWPYRMRMLKRNRPNKDWWGQ